MTEDSNFVLDNKAIGRNISMYRKIKGLKAAQVADKLGMKESSYTRYERGEGTLTIDFVQQVSEILNVHPITLLSTHPSTIIENGNNSSFVGSQVGSNNNFVNEEQNKMMLELMKNQMALTERFMAFLEAKGIK